MTDRSDSLYFTAPVADIGSLDKLPGWENLIVSDIPPDSTLGETLSAPTMSCWIGEPGVVTQAHYDVANNIFVQLHGQKEITFYHPNQAPNLYVFPDAHPRSRKSQVDFDQPNLLQFPGFASAEKWQTVILNPGDAVYIPSFWFHHVEALTTSVSVNCFSESILKFYAASIFNHKIDKLAAVRTHKNVKRKKELVVDFVAQLIAGLGLRKDFVQQLYHSRYSPLDISAAATKSESFCQRSQKEPVFAGIELNKRVLSQECNDAWNLELAPLYTIFDKIRGPDKQADKDTSYSSGVVEIVASHLVEFWVVRLFGSKNAGPVLRQLSEDEF
ncbi:hypothetical protein, variant [Sphaeroforma arctica JP610]|nr:hypothetical protein, variant [Sphaeroforma arctica JP610]KNC83231.1 hypothetical protein, variant [Sphaeroforma arctica JP610]|eukprot:XP_014157133.1 hypothetical protein, variant [Sphaeroforma arctica JP610]